MNKIESDLMLWAAYLRKKYGLKKTPKVAILDNPETMMREAWADGRPIVAVSMEVISEKRAGRFPAERWPFYLPQTKFIPKQFAGDKEAIWPK